MSTRFSRKSIGTLGLGGMSSSIAPACGGSGFSGQRVPGEVLLPLLFSRGIVDTWQGRGRGRWLVLAPPQGIQEMCGYSQRPGDETMPARRRAFTLIELPAVRKRAGPAFTLIELLVVIAIIALLVTCSFRPFGGRVLRPGRPSVRPICTAGASPSRPTPLRRRAFSQGSTSPEHRKKRLGRRHRLLRSDGTEIHSHQGDPGLPQHTGQHQTEEGLLA